MKDPVSSRPCLPRIINISLGVFKFDMNGNFSSDGDLMVLLRFTALRHKLKCKFELFLRLKIGYFLKNIKSSFSCVKIQEEISIKTSWVKQKLFRTYFYLQKLPFLKISFSFWDFYLFCHTHTHTKRLFVK